MTSAGLSSEPPSLEEPWIHAGNGLTPADLGVERIGVERSCLDALPTEKFAWLDADWALGEKDSLPFRDGDFVQLLTPKHAEQVREKRPDLEGIRGELRDAFRWFKLHGNKRSLVWCGMPLNRLDPQGLLIS